MLTGHQALRRALGDTRGSLSPAPWAWGGAGGLTEEARIAVPCEEDFREAHAGTQGSDTEGRPAW